MSHPTLVKTDDNSDTPPLVPLHQKATRAQSSVTVEDGFMDDDQLMMNATEEEILAAMQSGENYIERDDFERELGSPNEDAFSEDFSSIANHRIVDVVGDDRAGRPIVVVYAFRLPSNKTFDHTKFLRYLMQTLSKFVNQDYTILYFHYGLRSHNKPPIRWLLEAYRLLDRKYKKNLKALYLVHPTRFIKILWNVFKPFISIKFERKLHYVNFLHELASVLHLEQLQLPKAILDHDAVLIQQTNRAGISKTEELKEIAPTTQFGASLHFIMDNHAGNDIPPVLDDLICYLRAEALDVEGLFRRSANLATLRDIQARVNNGEVINFHQLGDVHLAAVLIKTFLRELKEPIIPFNYYDNVIGLNNDPNLGVDTRLAEVKKLVEQLAEENYRTLKALIRFLTEVAMHSDKNLMTSNNLAIVFGPNLAWPKDQQISLLHLRELNQFAYLLIVNFDKIFTR